MEIFDGTRHTLLKTEMTYTGDEFFFYDEFPY